MIGAIGASETTAKVVVLNNRTTSSVTVTLLPADQPSENMTLGVGESRPVFFERSLRVRYREGRTPREYTLEPARAYFFTAGLEAGSLHLERIGLGSESTTFPALSRRRFQLASKTPTIAVKLLVDDDEPTHRRIWEARLRKRVGAASKILEQHSGVRLAVHSISTWDSDDAQHDFNQSLREFEREVTVKPAQLAIGFSSQYRIVRGRVHMGGTRGALHPYILLKERSPNVREAERLELLIHELGHYLGAAHSPEPQSVMRPLIRSGQQRLVGSRIRFDPVNTLLIAMMGDEMRRSPIRSALDLSDGTRQRMGQLYSVLASALPDDPAAERYQQLMEAANSPPLVEQTRRVLAEIVDFAKRRRAGTSRSAEDPDTRDWGDALTDLYVRQAATAAKKLPPKNAAKALLLALGIFMDDTTLLRTFPTTRTLVQRVEDEQQRRERLRARGSPSMRGRQDLAKHFFVSAHVSVVMGIPMTRSVGLAKEMMDARRGSGFSFADMAANRAGIAFAARLLAGQISIDEIAKEFRSEDYLPHLDDLAEGLGVEELEAQFGELGNQALTAELTRIERRILAQPVYEHAETE